MPVLSAPHYDPPSQIRLFHITSRRNLENMIAQGGLWCSNLLEQQNIERVSAAHGHIRERRATTKVPCGPGGTLSDYVPWSFARRQPMLCSLAHLRVEGQQVRQSDMVHLVTTLDEVKGAGLQWVFTDGHPLVIPSKFFISEVDFKWVDWPLMKEQWWNNTSEDGGRTRRRQAELLIHHFVPWRIVRGIATKTEAAAQEVRELLSGTEKPPSVKVKPNWYF